MTKLAMHSVIKLRATVIGMVFFGIASSSAAQKAPTAPTAPTGTVVKISDVQVTDVTPNSATVRWSTDAEIESRASYGTSKVYTLMAQPSEDPNKKRKEHVIILTGLIPGTTYHLQLNPTTPLIAEPDRTFATPPQAAWYGNFAIIYVAALLLFASVPILVDISKTYKAQEDVRQKFAPISNVTPEQLAVILSASAGIPGLGRYTIAISVVMVIGLALFHILINPQSYSQAQTQTFTAVLSLLGGTLATITGFYFGGKTAEAIQKATQIGAAATASTGSQPEITNVKAIVEPPPAGGGPNRDITVTWTTTTPADSQVIYGNTTAYGQVYPAAPADQVNRVRDHKVTIQNMAPGNYHYQVVSRIGTLEVRSADATFTV